MLIASIEALTYIVERLLLLVHCTRTGELGDHVAEHEFQCLTVVHRAEDSTLKGLVVAPDALDLTQLITHMIT